MQSTWQTTVALGKSGYADVGATVYSLTSISTGGLANEGLQPFHVGMYPHAPAADVRIMNEDQLPDGLQVIHQHMMHHPVAEIGGEDFPQLGALGNKADRTGRGVAAVLQRRLQIQQVIFLADLEGQSVGDITLVAPALQIRPVQVLEGKQQEASFSGTNRPRNLLRT